MDTRHFTTIILLAAQVMLWANFLLSSERTSSTLIVISCVISILFCASLTITRATAPGIATRDVAIAAVITISLLVGDFSSIYYSYGTDHNWSIPLTHLDAVFISFGTLTTVGTGDIQPKSELARGLLTAQMGVDLIAVTLLTAFVLHRFTVGRRQ